MAIIPYIRKNGNKTPGLYIREEDGTFYLVKSIDGKTRFKSLETKSEKIAKSKLFEAESSLRNEEKNKTPENKILKEYWSDYFDLLRSSGRREKTLISADVVWRNSISEYWGLLKPDDISQENVDNFIKWRRRKKPGQSLFNHLKYLKGFFKFLLSRDLLTKMPKIELPEDEKKHLQSFKGRVPTREEVSAILDVADNSLKLMIILGFERGMRLMEIGSLKKSQISKIGEKYVIKLEKTKTGKSRTVPVPKAAEDLLKKALQNGKDFIFPGNTVFGHVASQTIDKAWRKALKKSGAKGRIRFHDLRHGAVSNFKRMGLDPVVACELLGMSMVHYQKTYGKLSAHDIIEVLERIGGLS